MRKLQENPDDNEAMDQMNKAQQQLAEWNASGQAGMSLSLQFIDHKSESQSITILL